MKEDQTTLAVPKTFAEDLRKNYNGHNDAERLREWAEQHESEDYKNLITVDDVEDAVSRAIERDLPEVLRREMR